MPRNKLTGPDAKLIKLCIRALGAQAACVTANGTPKGIPTDQMNALNDRVYAAIEPLAAMQATTEFGKRLKAKVGFEMLLSISDELDQREESVALSALRDLARSAVA